MTNASPTWVVCEDGHEYLQRFARFIPQVRFVRAGCAAELFMRLGEPDVAGVLLDLDFRRTPHDQLIDETGEPAKATAARGPLASQQGLFILRALRVRGVQLPVILWADLDDAAFAAELTSRFAPLRVAPSTASMKELAHWLA